METNFTCDFSDNETEFPHFWEHTIGSGHAVLALRADYQAQLSRCRQELGVKYVRFHGILCDDMGTFIIQDDKPLYSFFNSDQIIDFLLSIGMKPFVELSFMPTGLASGDKIAFHYRANVTPPKDLDQWAELINKLARHWVDRYGIEEVQQWFFEVWNEPNLEAFYTGKQDDYFQLYKSTVHALKNVSTAIKVGGPATAMNAWIPDFLAFCKKENLPADFVSTHHYPTDAFGKPGDDTETQLSQSTRSVLRNQAKTAKEEADGKPLYYTEWSSSSNPRDPMHDEPYAAAFIVKTIMEATGLVSSYSYWTFSDIFEENYFPSVPFHGGFGLLNIHNIAKPAYRAYQLLHEMGSRLFEVKGSHPTIDVWATKTKDVTTVMITNFALPRHPIEDTEIQIELKNISEPRAITVRRIDHDHANPGKQWQEMGAPTYLSPATVVTLQTASEMREESLTYNYLNDAVILRLTIPKLGIAAIKLQF